MLVLHGLHEHRSAWVLETFVFSKCVQKWRSALLGGVQGFGLCERGAPQWRLVLEKSHSHDPKRFSRDLLCLRVGLQRTHAASAGQDRGRIAGCACICALQGHVNGVFGRSWCLCVLLHNFEPQSVLRR